MELRLSVKQTMTLSPQLIQSMEILQMGSQELLEHVQEMSQENPLLEVADTGEKKEEILDLWKKVEWLGSMDVRRGNYRSDSDDDEKEPISNYSAAEQWEEVLPLHLISQLPARPMSTELELAAKFIIANLNDNGYLDEDLEVATAPLDCTLELAEEALRLVQSLEPAGVGARTLSECLCLQLQRKGESGTLAERIAKEYLTALARNQYAHIARELDADIYEVRRACDRIRFLNPKPGSGFSNRENLGYITPDIILIRDGDRFKLKVNDEGYFPNLSISTYYVSLMKGRADQDVKKYLTDKMRQAKWVIKSIEQRRSTIMDCALCILELQNDFFRYGPGHLVPMTLADVADKLGIHESTVSRAVKDKYIQCCRGVVPFSYFFSRALGGDGAAEAGTASPDGAKAMLKKLIEGEDKRKPLSDQKLTNLLEAEGITLSRRTVAKYRDELSIPSSAGRRQYDKPKA